MREGWFMREGIAERMQMPGLELTVQELTAIEHILARFSVNELAVQLGLADPSMGPVLASVLRKVGMAARCREANDSLGHTEVATSFDSRSGVTLQEQSQTVTILGERFVCKPTSFRVLSCLINSGGQWVRAEVLARDVLNTCFQKGASNVRWHVLQARRALGARGAFLHSDNRLGYMFDLAPCARKHCRVRR